MSKLKEKKRPILGKDTEQQALEEVASFLIHKLRNPLGGIKGFASLLERDLVDQPDLQKMAAMIVKGSDHLNEILSIILEYSKPLELKFLESDLSALIKKLSEDPHIRFSTKSNPVTILMDSDQMQKALSCLIKNSFQSMKDTGTVSISLEAEDTFAAITIKDSGIAISEERLSKAFSPFFTPPWGGKEGALAEIKKIVRAHGGSIEVFSIEGKGTTYTIKIPIKKG